MLRTFFSYKYVTVDLIKFLFLVLLWVLILSPNITRNVRYVNFYWNLSILPRHYETNILFSHTVKSSVYVCTFLSLYEPFLLFFVIDKSILSYFPSINTVVALNKCLYSKIHRTCFFSYFLSTLLSIPCATLWYFQLVIYLSNDISKIPGPQFHNNFFNFMSWNLNSIAKDNFHRVSLIEAHNSIFHYDLISIYETCLNDSVELPETLLGGAGLFYKNSLPVVIRNDLSFDESIVVELKFGRKKIFITVLYRGPAFDHNSANFQAFLLNVSNLYAKIKAENPFAAFFTGDFNAHSKYWWTDDDTTPEGSEIEHLLSSLVLSRYLVLPRDPPWIIKPIKTMLNRKNRLFKNYKKHRYKDEDKFGSMHFVLNVKRQSKLQNQLT